MAPARTKGGNARHRVLYPSIVSVFAVCLPAAAETLTVKNEPDASINALPIVQNGYGVGCFDLDIKPGTSEIFDIDTEKGCDFSLHVGFTKGMSTRITEAYLCDNSTWVIGEDNFYFE